MSVAAATLPASRSEKGAAFSAGIRPVADLGADEIAAWEALAQQASPFTVFQQPSYVTALKDAQILFLKRGETLCLALPFVVRTGGGVRTLTLAGAPVTQYDDVLVAPEENAQALLREAFAFLREQGVDAVRLERVPENSAFFTYQPLRTARITEQQAPMQVLKGMQSPQPGGSVSTKNLQRKKRKLEESGDVAFHALPAGQASADWVDNAIALKQKWLAERGDTSRLFANAQALQTFRDLFVRPGSSGWVFALTLNGDPLAVHLVFCTGKSQHQHFTVYESSYFRYSPSALLTFHQMEWAIARGMEVFDLMPPGFDYKKEWCDGHLKVYDVFLPLSIRGRLSPGNLLLKAKPMLRRVFYLLPDGMRRAALARLGC